jgi:phosphinothricin acetyltransferase
MTTPPLRHATEADLPRIVDIYNATVGTRRSTADTAPVTVASRRAWFRRHTKEHRPVLVHEIDGEVAGWISFSSFYGRPAYHHTAEISVYLAPEHRGKGIGRRILGEAISMAPRCGIKTLLAFIFSHNDPSLRLFRFHGFAEWGRLPDIAEMDGREYSLTVLGRRVAL